MDAEAGHGYHAARKGAGSASCTAKGEEEYTLKFRIAGTFIIFTTTSIAVLGPILLRKFARLHHNGLIFTAMKQFGTGVIVSTVFVHLLMQAFVRFANPCVGEVKYEGTSMAIAMGGAFLSFLVDHAGTQWLASKYPRNTPEFPPPLRSSMYFPPPHRDGKSQVVFQTLETMETPNLDLTEQTRVHKERLNVMIMEGGIILHAMLAGLLLNVTSDDKYTSMFAVILLHQMFEGLALGARIETLDFMSYTKKVLMGIVFSSTCPTGMGIGIGVRHSFNGNQKSTVLGLGTLYALGAGVLAWVAFVVLWSADWLHGDLRMPVRRKGAVGMLSLLLGGVLTSVLGIWT